jgi:hypothetical protein
MRPTILSLAGSARRSASTIDNQQSNPATPSRPPRPQRSPLQLRDGNAMMRAPQKGAPLSTRSGNAMPPHDKPNGASRPVVPTLGASSTKTVNKTPLTPRVAGSTQSLASSPLTRRGAHQDGSTTPTLSQKEDFSTPLSSFLNTNITPRSGSRKTRVDSANSTPTHTPTGTSTPDVLRVTNNGTGYGVGGLNISGLQSDGTKRPTVSFSPAVSELGSQREHLQSGGDTKFFYANEAKSAVQHTKQQLPAQDSKGSTFFYANGDKIPPSISSSGSAVGSAVGSTVGEDRAQPKFFHANGTPDLPPQHFSAASSPVSNPQFTAPRLAARSPGRALSPLQRPPSPLKAHQSISSAQSKHAATLPSPILPRSHAAQDVPIVKSKDIDTTRRTSGHERAASTGLLDMSPSTRRASNHVTIALPSPPFPVNITTAGMVSTAEELLPESVNDGESPHSDVQSPVKAGHSLERLNEFAANARRERKVLDLEITNSSLAAINRTLEREMRKQTAELRRYRRLSRSGRLSINTSTSLRTSSGTHSIMDDVDSTPLSDMSEESDGDEGEESSEEESIDDGSLSPGAMAESDARHRERDEKRLQLDLSKHQQLLIDSQNMNQSLKRCLGWTEELINEGKKALAYHVRVSDIELGGRVLAPDEVDDNDNESLSDFGPSALNQLTAEATTSEYQEVDRENLTANGAETDTEIDHASPAMGLSVIVPVDMLAGTAFEGSGDLHKYL